MLKDKSKYTRKPWKIFYDYLFGSKTGQIIIMLLGLIISRLPFGIGIAIVILLGLVVYIEESEKKIKKILIAVYRVSAFAVIAYYSHVLGHIMYQTSSLTTMFYIVVSIMLVITIILWLCTKNTISRIFEEFVLYEVLVLFNVASHVLLYDWLHNGRFWF